MFVSNIFSIIDMAGRWTMCIPKLHIYPGIALCPPGVMHVPV